MRLKLGLIGDNIAASRAPDLHRWAGRMAGIETTYDRLVPADCGLGFEDLFRRCQTDGYDGLNITYPYKSDAARLVTIADPHVAALGAVNTVVFSGGGASGFNTDYSGFMTAIRQGLGGRAPGVACLVGAGGVGKAMAFGLIALGASAIRITDLDQSRSRDLALALATAAPEVTVTTHDSVEHAAEGADGILNASPIGMDGYPGSPVDPALLEGAAWAFDAIYTPRETRFLRAAHAAGLVVVPGYELFLHQGLDAWRIFSGQGAVEAQLRQYLER